VTPYYEAQSKPLTGAADIVGAIVVDFRGFDTMIEISVFSMAGIGVYMLLRHAKLKHGDRTQQTLPAQPFPPNIKGIGGTLTSPFVHTLAYFVLPVAIVVGLVHMFYGHDQPGDGFTAGVIISIAMAFWYVVFGYERTKAMLPWLKAHVLIGCGIMTVMIGSIAPVLLGMNFFAPVDFGQMWNLPLPEGLYLSTSTMFELAICLSVLGSATYIVDTLGRPDQLENA
jgi:multicomponent K+:H+ antiporter subunit A